MAAAFLIMPLTSFPKLSKKKKKIPVLSRVQMLEYAAFWNLQVHNWDLSKCPQANIAQG